MLIRESRFLYRLYARQGGLRSSDFWARMGREGRNRVRQQNAWWRVVPLLVAAGVVVPVVIYLLAYSQMFSMGYSLSYWWSLQQQMYWYHTGLKATHRWASDWWTWPLLIKPVWFWVKYYPNNPKQVADIFALGNPLVFWGFLPAIAYTAYEWYKGHFRSVALGLILLGFFGNWLAWSFSPRISLLYHFLPCVPFGALAIAYALSRLEAPRVVLLGYFLPVLVAFVYFYPIYAAWPISTDYTSQHYWMDSWVPR